MAGERILIVDDTPVNLKLTRILLVNEGYTVRTAGSAEEALELLPSYQPRLILADIQLPGMDGLEMTRRIKENPLTREVLVIALTAFAMMGDESRAIEAGCGGYITKPINTRTLGSQIRELLAQHPGGQPPGDAGQPARESLPAAELHALRRRFLQEGQQKARQLLLDLDGFFDATDSARAVHQWVGTGGLLGYPALSRLAREVEMLLRERPLDAAQVRECLTTLLMAFDTPPEAIDAPVPDGILKALSGRCVALAGLPASETQRLGIALERVHARAVFLEPNATSALQLDGCHLVAAYIRPGAAGWPWSDPAAPSALPVVFIGEREHIAALDPTVQALAAGFLMDAWQPDEALVRLGVAIARYQPTPPALAGGPIRVIAADGDAGVLDQVRAALRDSGIEVHLASDGIQALEKIRSLHPQAAIIDANLPGLDGYAVLDAVRTEGLAVRVMLLAVRQQESDVFHGFESGAGDYLVTPFSPLELLMRLNRLLAK